MCRTSLSAFALLIAATLSPAADRYQSSEPHMGTLVTTVRLRNRPTRRSRRLLRHSAVSKHWIGFCRTTTPTANCLVYAMQEQRSARS